MSSKPPEASKDLSYESSHGVATIAFCRPQALNAYTTETLEELARLVERAARDDSVGVIVLTGTGTRAFCTGGDVKEYSTHYVQRPHDYWKYMGTFRRAVEALLDCGKPTIARLNGMAIGGGNELQLACDISIAAEHIALGQVGVGVGSVACGGATQWLPLAVGDRRARAMLMLNERVPAQTALDWGLITRMVPSVTVGGYLIDVATPEQIEKGRRGLEGHGIDLSALDAAVAETAKRLLSMFPECLRYTKEQTNFWKSFSWHQTIGHAREWLALHFATYEPFEGMKAFVDKRPARIPELRQELADGGSPEYLYGAPSGSCGSCGATDLPAKFPHCGKCGAKL